jgi:hypothetical protein
MALAGIGYSAGLTTDALDPHATTEPKRLFNILHEPAQDSTSIGDITDLRTLWQPKGVEFQVE